MPAGFLQQLACVLVANSQRAGCVLGAVDSTQQLGSGFWAHPAVSDAALHALGAGFAGSATRELLLPASLGCHCACQELHGERSLTPVLGAKLSMVCCIGSSSLYLAKHG